MLSLSGQLRRTREREQNLGVAWIRGPTRQATFARVPRVLLDKLSLSSRETACILCRGGWGAFSRGKGSYYGGRLSRR